MLGFLVTYALKNYGVKIIVEVGLAIEAQRRLEESLKRYNEKEKYKCDCDCKCKDKKS